jgi:radical SAM protein with 4Fe4S-binding SPASM domain
MYHPDRIAQWQAAGDEWEKAKSVYPLYVEIAPAGACNHRCTFCAVDYIGYKTRSLEKTLLIRRVTEMAERGVRSIMYAGEGEPLLHRHIGEIIVQTQKAGIDVAITTNAVALNEHLIYESLGSITWIKASVNAGTPETYAAVHQTKADDFGRVFRNLTKAAEVKQANHYACTIGVQMVLLPENQHEAVILAKRSKDAGADYIVIKPYSQHLMSLTTMEKGYKDFDYSLIFPMEEEFSALEDGRFKVIFRRRTMEKLLDQDRHYTICQATPFFWAYVMANGEVYGCSAYLQDSRFCYGNLNERSFTEIWEGEARQKSFHHVRQELNIVECRRNCRMDEVNRYLWDLQHPPGHVNFI